MADVVAIDEAEGGQGVVGALEGGHSCGAPGHAVGADEEASSAAQQLVVELLPKALAEQVESKGVDTRVSERQDPSTDAGNEMQHWGVHLGVVVGAVQVDDVSGQPAEGKEAHKDQHGPGQALTGLNLGKERETQITCCS